MRGLGQGLGTTAFTASGPTAIGQCPGILGEREGLSGPPAHPGQASGLPGAAWGLWAQAARRRHTGSSLEERWTPAKTEMDYLSVPSSQTLNIAEDTPW